MSFQKDCGNHFQNKRSWAVPCSWVCPWGDHTNSIRPHLILISRSPSPSTQGQSQTESLVHTEKTLQMSVVAKMSPKPSTMFTSFNKVILLQGVGSKEMILNGDKVLCLKLPIKFFKIEKKKLRMEIF